MKLLIAPDKFKGSLSALQAAESLRDGFASVWPHASFDLRPVADGGEGTAEVLVRALNGSWIEAEVQNPLGQKITARYGWVQQSGAHWAIMEMSEASGLKLFTPNQRRPLHANTFGTGQMILDAARRGAQKIIIGLGGSATNDAGIGLAAAFGFRFLDSQGIDLLPIPEAMPALASIQPPQKLTLPLIIAAVDVRNPLLGPHGATRTYGPQKGPTPDQLDFLENTLKHIADVTALSLGNDPRETPGTGAAGGLGFGLMAFANAEIRQGFGLVADALQLDQAVSMADLVVTGEGSLDAQTLHGKAPAGVAELARKRHKPVIAFAGCVSDETELATLFDAVCPIVHKPTSLEDAVNHAAPLLRQSAARAARLLQTGLQFPASR